MNQGSFATLKMTPFFRSAHCAVPNNSVILSGAKNLLLAYNFAVLSHSA